MVAALEKNNVGHESNPTGKREQADCNFKQGDPGGSC